MAKGTISNLPIDKYYGFISEQEPEKGTSRFFFFNDSPGVAYEEYKVGMEVEYDLAPPRDQNKPAQATALKFTNKESPITIKAGHEPAQSASENSKIDTQETKQQDAQDRKNGIIIDFDEEKGRGKIQENTPPSIPRGEALFFHFNKSKVGNIDFLARTWRNGGRNIEVSYAIEGDKRDSQLPGFAVDVKISTVDPAVKRQFIALQDWAHFQSFYASLDDLKRIALPENWSFGKDGTDNRILGSYFIHTFGKLQMEKHDAIAACKMNGRKKCYDDIDQGVCYSADFSLAAFNTGLVTSLYEPIIAVFYANQPENEKPYIFRGFCVRGTPGLGKEVNEKIIGQLGRAKYFSEMSDCLYLKPEADVQFSWRHIVIDGVARGRFPSEFIIEHCRRILDELGINTNTPQNLSLSVLRNVAVQVEEESDEKTLKRIIASIKSSLEATLKRVSWNFKTAIPVWYPKAQKLSLLLPLCLVDEQTPDTALVVEQIVQKKGFEYRNINYTAHTIYTLDIAYNNSRLVCRPDSDWLRPESISRSPSPYAEED